MLAIRSSISQSRPHRLQAKTFGLCVKGDGRPTVSLSGGLMLFALPFIDIDTTDYSLLSTNGFASTPSSFTSKPCKTDNYYRDGLLDGEARYSMAFAMNDRVKVPSSDPITVDNVWVRAPLAAIERGEIRLGLTHTKLDELTITAKAGDEEAELPIPDDPGQYLYTSFDVFELGFTRSCLNKTEQWTFTVEGGGSGKGYIEYIELNVVMWTDPNSVDSNNDGLSDIEQLRRGEYGWLTDPWNEDTDGDKCDIDYDIIQESWTGDVSGSTASGLSTTSGDHAEIDFKVETVKLERVNTIIINATDGELYETPDGDLRYTGEQRFYVFEIDVESAGNGFVSGLNTIIVSRHTFGESYLNSTLAVGTSGGVPSVVKDLDFSAKKTDKDASGPVVNVVSGELTNAEAVDLMELLIYSDSTQTKQIANWSTVSNICTIGLAGDVLDIIPQVGFSESDHGDLPETLAGVIIGGLVELVVSAGELLYNGLLAIGDFIADFADMVKDWGLKLWKGIKNFFDDVKAAVSEVVEMMKALGQWIVSHISGLFSRVWDAVVSGLESWAEGIQEAMEKFFEELAEWNEMDGSESMDDTMEAGTSLMLSFIGQQDRASELMDVQKRVMEFIEPFQQYISPFGLIGIIGNVLGTEIPAVGDFFDTMTGAIGEGIGWILNRILGNENSLFSTLGLTDVEIDTEGFPDITLQGIENFVDNSELLKDNMLIQTVLTAVGEVIESYQSDTSLASGSELVGLLATWGALLIGAVTLPLSVLLAFGSGGGYMGLILETLSFIFTQISLLTTGPFSIYVIAGLAFTTTGCVAALAFSADPYTRGVSLMGEILTLVSVVASAI